MCQCRGSRELRPRPKEAGSEQREEGKGAAVAETPEQDTHLKPNCPGAGTFRHSPALKQGSVWLREQSAKAECVHVLCPPLVSREI